MLQIKLEAVLNPGVLFFDCNATRCDAVQSSSPNVAHFDVVKAADRFRVATELRRFYQAEMLVSFSSPGEKKLKREVSKTENAESCKTSRSSINYFFVFVWTSLTSSTFH